MSTGLRTHQADHTRQRIVDAALELFIAGEEVGMRSVAKHAGVGERTMYRYFETRDVLAQAVRKAIEPRAGAGFVDSVDELHAYADRLFSVFEENEKLIHALTSRAGLMTEFKKTRTAWRKRYRKLLTEAFPGAPTDRIEASISILRGILSGAGWSNLRQSGVAPSAVRSQAHWAIDLVLGALRDA